MSSFNGVRRDDEVEEEAGQPRENGQEESLAIAWAEPEDEPGPKVSSPFLM